MKTILTCILLTGLLATACKKDDVQPTAQSQTTTQQNSLLGNWTGTNVYSAAGKTTSYPVTVSITPTVITITNSDTNDVTAYNYTLQSVSNNIVMYISSDLSLTVLGLTSTAVTIVNLQNKQTGINLSLTK